eukprot:6143332-Pleurochrysis_carterae.AAC.1
MCIRDSLGPDASKLAPVGNKGGGLPRNGKPNCTLICALHFTQADHTIATARASESTGRSNEKLVPALE